MSLPYIGADANCFADSVAMVLPPNGPESSLIGVVTGAPYGICIRFDHELCFFLPYDWDPNKGIDEAIDLLGWACDLTTGGSAEEAIDRLREASARAPVLVGPFELGFMLHHPGSGKAIGSDHFVTVMGVTEDTVHMHDPHGFPHVTMPVSKFAAAWVADTVGYKPQPYTMRANFRMVESLDEDEILRRALPRALVWLAGTITASDSGELAGATACEHLAETFLRGLSMLQYNNLAYFGIRTAARRLSDMATLFERIGAVEPAKIADEQARIVGAMQYSLIMRDRPALAGLAREFGPSFQRLYTALEEYINVTPRSGRRAFETV